MCMCERERALPFWPVRCSRFILYIACPGTRISHLFQDPWFLLLQNGIRTKIKVISVLIATDMLLLLGPLSWHSKEVHVCMYTNPCNIHTYYIYIHIYIFTYLLTSHSNSEKPGYHHLLPIYLIVWFQYTYLAQSELLTGTSIRKNFTE